MGMDNELILMDNEDKKKLVIGREKANTDWRNY